MITIWPFVVTWCWIETIDDDSLAVTSFEQEEKEADDEENNERFYRFFFLHLCLTIIVLSRGKNTVLLQVLCAF